MAQHSTYKFWKINPRWRNLFFCLAFKFQQLRNHWQIIFCLAEKSDWHFLLDINSLESIFEFVERDKTVSIKIGFHDHPLSNGFDLKFSIKLKEKLWFFNRNGHRLGNNIMHNQHFFDRYFWSRFDLIYCIKCVSSICLLSWARHET